MNELPCPFTMPEYEAWRLENWKRDPLYPQPGSNVEFSQKFTYTIPLRHGEEATIRIIPKEHERMWLDGLG